ncbi:acyl-CoA synthetase [Paracoccus fistulariae]|uniref:Acyl-CoA synthetase n=1 Tax=Paracoccus fistulariae TaxID=658446 RepID=A0ABY7SKD5_9RHOB|nr:acyl-CoA synthetase [Paracoccus fistulariae]MDB6181430.1 acyl-CoA synthetase [Paracoccus fistulariae]WCR07471.1 acyl-CoA synthetase [Paracoccus fistulariae]
MIQQVPVSTRVMNLATFLTQAARRDPEGIALVMGDRRWNWAEFDARTDALAHALQHRFGLQQGDRVMCQSQNCPEMMQAMFAVWRAGGVWVPANFRQTPEEVVYLTQSSGARILLCNAAFPDHAAACRADCPELAAILSFDSAEFGPSVQEVTASAMGQRPQVAAVDRDDPCWFFFTSGTTGRPKASVLTHGQMGFVVTNHLADLMPGLTPQDASLVVAPLSHGAGVHQLTQVARGVKTILMPTERFDVATVWDLVRDWRVSTMFTVPTILKRLVEDPATATADTSSLRYVIYAGAPMYRVDQQNALNTLGKVLVQYFGLGECTGNITVLPAYLHQAEDGPEARIGTCGYARTGIEIQIQDDQGRELPPGQTGEICCIGPAVFAGYYQNPEANAKAFRNGWFRTGDLGHMDEAGFLFITGRESDMFISGGSNIYPREIEEKILTHPAINEVAVLGMPDPVWGEVGWAICVTSAPVEAGELAAFLDGKLSRYKMPKRFVFWEALPKSAYGKITKKMIRAELGARGLIDEEARA